MQYRTFPDQTEQLSILGFGCMRFPTTPEGKIETSTAHTMLQTAYAQGVNYFDTAWPYHNGESEILLGNFVKTLERSSVYIADKLPTWLIKTSADLMEYLDKQLEKLQTDYIDYYLLHSLNAKSWQNLLENDVFGFIRQAQSSGKIRKIGFSFHDEYKTFKKIIDAYHWDFCQIQLNFIDTREQAGLRGLRYAASKGIGIIIMEPLKGGKLVDKIPADVSKIWSKSRFQDTSAARALKWVWNLPEVTLLLSGMSEPEQVAENVALTNEGNIGCINDTEQRLYQKVRRIYLAKTPVPCTGCRYCLPCPHNVAIPFCFGIYMEAHMFDDLTRHKKEYNWFVPEAGKADKCTKCGVCISKCPQKIDIPLELERVASYFS
jgi:predicted aldo/keto reductase-like oxidoreductase